jgi:transcription-repair coupling factor (superfamily II helicase)
MKLVKMIQQQSKRFKLEGADKLRFIEPMAEPLDRIDYVRDLIRTLAG